MQSSNFTTQVVKQPFIIKSFQSTHPDPIKDKLISMAFKCTDCESVKPIHLRMSLIGVPSIKKQVCLECMVELDSPGFDWDAWQVTKV